MEESGNVGCLPTKHEMEDLAPKKLDACFINNSVMADCSLVVVSDISENSSFFTTESLPNNEDSTNHSPFGNDKKHLEESKDQYGENDACKTEYCESTTTSSEVQEVTSTYSNRMIVENQGIITMNDDGSDGDRNKTETNSDTKPLHRTPEDIESVDQETSLNISEKKRNDWEVRSANGRKRHFSDVRSHQVSGKDKESCIYCTREKTEAKSRSLGISIQDFNVELKQRAVIPEVSCCLCTLNLSDDKSFPPLGHKNEHFENNKKESSQTSETDVNRPHSRVSEKSNSSSNTSVNLEPKKNKREVIPETDPAILSRRQKQIEYGKNTIGYHRYKELIPKDQRSRQDPQTPPKCVKYSRRAWDGLIKAWRRKLHDWDPPKSEVSDDEICSILSSSSFPTSEDSENLMDVHSEIGMERRLSNVLENDDASSSEDSNQHQ